MSAHAARPFRPVGPPLFRELLAVDMSGDRLLRIRAATSAILTWTPNEPRITSCRARAWLSIHYTARPP